jgi:hypothetical protein
MANAKASVRTIKPSIIHGRFRRAPPPASTHPRIPKLTVPYTANPAPEPLRFDLAGSSRAEAALVVTVSTEVTAEPSAGAVNEAGAKPQLIPAGSEPQEKLTVPSYPLEPVSVIVVVPDCPCGIDSVVGFAVTL